jgi:acetate kinase
MELILAVNGGSSTLKLALFEGENQKPLWQTHLDWQGDFEAKLKTALQALPTHQIAAIGHRVVHGGETFTQTARIDHSVKEEIRKLFFLVPLHNPINLAGIETCERLFPSVAQFAVFDTAFHMTLNEAAFTYPLLYKYRSQGIRRFGFHGISYSYCSKKCAAFLKRSLKDLKMVICHLGAGASLCAIKGGKSVDTTMGMTPLEGLMMATRSGSIDPGILLYLLKDEKISVAALEKELNEASGLLGISGLSGDMRKLIEAAEQGSGRAHLALEMFLHRLTSCLGSMIASLGGVDVIVFTAGIGEHSPLIREKTCAQFAFLGTEIDPEKNRSSSKDEREISSGKSQVKVVVIPTCEEWEIAYQCRQELKQSIAMS